MTFVWAINSFFQKKLNVAFLLVMTVYINWAVKIASTYYALIQVNIYIVYCKSRWTGWIKFVFTCQVFIGESAFLIFYSNGRLGGWWVGWRTKFTKNDNFLLHTPTQQEWPTVQRDCTLLYFSPLHTFPYPLFLVSRCSLELQRFLLNSREITDDFKRRQLKFEEVYFCNLTLLSVNKQTSNYVKEFQNRVKGHV